MPSGSLFDELKSSVILPISQCSSELFHSNFLHFIAERFPGYFSKVLSDLIGSHIGYRTVARGYKHTDLSFFDVDIEQYKKGNKTPVPVLLIENKMKSLPSREQLDDYLEKLMPGLDAGSLQKELIDKLGIDIDNFRSYNNMFYSDVGDVGQLTLTDVIDKMKNEILDVHTSYQTRDKSLQFKAI